MLHICSAMALNTVLFDMDGLLIDSEPLWQEAGSAALAEYGITLTDDQYHSSTGLRTPEWIDHWFRVYGLEASGARPAIDQIESNAIEMIRSKGVVMPGVDYIINFFREQGFRIGLASSSPMRLIQVVVDKLNIREHLEVIISAEKLPYGKPHPQVFMEAAAALQVSPGHCVVFEDSFNGMIAAKAAKMKCVVVPAPSMHHETRWDAADYKLSRLDEFNMEVLKKIN